jgi:uncharacterized surface protein with fasciclin (FAS1) repeats
MSTRFHRVLLAGVVALGVAACDDPAAPEATEPDLASETLQSRSGRGQTIADIAVAASQADEPEFTILVQALQAADLVGVLDGRRQFTVFAPTDAAFVRLLDLLGVSAEQLLADTELLTSVLLYHVAPGNRDSGDVFDSDQIRTLNRGFVFPTLVDDVPFIVDGSPATEDAQVLVADLEASNGVIHVIDEVLVPGEGSRPGKGDDDEDEDEDEEDEDEDEDEEEEDEAEEDDEPTIAGFVAGAAAEGQFTILLAALQAADLVDALDGDRDLTVFAPTDEAFGRLLELLDVEAADLLADTELLTSVLLYHVVPGERFSRSVLRSRRIRTLNGAFVFPRVRRNGAFIVDGSPATENAQLQAPDLIDIEVDNGVIHVIDEVLLP